MRKVWLIMREALHLVARNKMWFLLPPLIGLALLAVLAYSFGPVAMVTFLYAGI